jgi:GNAT superfamily N-acetyltransferase
MKSIGVNQWAGADPWLADIISELEQQATRARQAESHRWKRMSPSDKFFKLANDRFQVAKLFGIAPVRGYWQIGDWTLAEINPMSLEDATGSRQCLVHLQSLFVVDAARGRGEGKRSIEQIKKLADECGCGVTLFAKSFAFSRDGNLPYAVQTFEELRTASLEEKWPIIYLPEWDVDCLRFFYEGCGFQNMCLYGSWVYQRPKEEDLSFDRQFVYLPKSMDPAWRSQIEHRLNPDLCEFCNR